MRSFNKEGELKIVFNELVSYSSNVSKQITIKIKIGKGDLGIANDIFYNIINITGNLVISFRDTTPLSGGYTRTSTLKLGRAIYSDLIELQERLRFDLKEWIVKTIVGEEDEWREQEEPRYPFRPTPPKKPRKPRTPKKPKKTEN